MSSDSRRVVSGMRPTGALHLGHYHGVLANWLKLQHEYECFFFVADWHALTTHYDDTGRLSDHSLQMAVDWLAAGIDPGSANIFLQSQVPEHAELHVLLSMITPLSWLERVPTYKDQQEKLREKDLATYGFLGYPTLQSADILVYRADLVPVGEDQVSHIELTRELARRFNFVFGREPDFEERAEAAVAKMGKKAAKLFRNYLKQYREQGDANALEIGGALLAEQQNITIADKERLQGYLEGSGRIILPEPEVLLTKASKMPGLDGQKMSKSYGNTIGLREAPEELEQKIRRMPTDPARVRLNDPGDPAKCPVWQLHEVYSDEKIKGWVQEGCKAASIGCLECKTPLIESVQAELEPIRNRAIEFANDLGEVRSILNAGADKARDAARETLAEVRAAVGLTDA